MMKLTIDQALLKAVELHKEGKLQVAEGLYKAILQIQPKHPDANHNLGVLAVSLNNRVAALSLFKTALEVSPNEGQFWISYIDALIKEKQLENASNAILKAKKAGLSAKAITTLEVQLTQTKALQGPAPSAHIQTQLNSPNQTEIDALLEHYQSGQYDVAEDLAKTITHAFPRYQFGWKLLGALYQYNGRLEESLVANETAVAIWPNDSEANNNLGITLQALGRMNDAEESFKKAIWMKPDFSEAYFNLGITLQTLSRHREAEENYKKAIAYNPDRAEAYFNLGITLQTLGKPEEAEQSFKKAIVIEPQHLKAHLNLGITIQSLGRFVEAEEIFKIAIVIKPDDAETHFNLGNTLINLGSVIKAEASYQQAIALKPDYAEAHNNLAYALLELGKLKEAEISYRNAIAINPAYEENCTHLLAAINGLNPLRATDAYVSSLFDSYAKKFDSSLVDNLNYITPTSIASLLRSLISSANSRSDILDLGCGTGLAGEALVDLAKTLVGIDLSKEMLKLAKAKNIYDRLIQDEIHHALGQENASSFDVVVSCDVFIYIGDLREIFDGVFNVLRVGGFFAFSTEALFSTDFENTELSPGYKLTASARYSHSAKYLSRLIDPNRFALHIFKEEQIRIEKGKPVMGYLVVIKKKPQPE